VIALVFLIVVAILIPKVYHFYIVKPPVIFIDTLPNQEYISIKADSTVSVDNNGSKALADTAHAGSLFTFDPNTIGMKEWVRLGLTDKQAASIEKYKSKGGKFINPDDLRKVYVLSDEMKAKLIPYVKIGTRYKHGEVKNIQPIEINTADSAAFESLPGIGPVRAAKILNYRRLLGGFYSIDQLSEVRGIPDSTYGRIMPYVRVDQSGIRQIDINAADFETLRKHPYIHAKIARALIEYRNFNGKYESRDEVAKVKGINENEYKKIYPYLKTGR
jgi:competence protein ComEA